MEACAVKTDQSRCRDGQEVLRGAGAVVYGNGRSGAVRVSHPGVSGPCLHLGIQSQPPTSK